jgi:iron(III) transport system permease protein
VTYIVAYIYVDIFDAFGPCRTPARSPAGGRKLWYPDIRSLPGAIFVFSCVLYPYVFLAARAVADRARACSRVSARSAPSVRAGAHVALPLARPALAVGLSLACWRR